MTSSGSRRFRALRHHRLQVALTVAAIGAAVVLPVVLLSVGGGVAEHEIRQLESSGYQLTVSAPGVHGIEGAHALAQAIDAIPHVAQASPVLSVAIDLFTATGATTPVLAEGVIPQAFSATLSPEEAGLFPSVLPFSEPTDRVHYANGTYAGPPTLELMLAGPLAQAEGLSVGERVGLAATANASAAVPFTVVGTFATPQSTLGPTAAFALVLPLSDLQVLAGLATSGTGGPALDAADLLDVALAGAASTDPGQVAQVAQAVQLLVPYYSVVSLSDQVAQLRASAAVLEGFYLALSSVGLAVGLVFLAVVLVRRVEVDRRIIGIQRAIGVPSRQVAADWLRAGLELSGAGGAAGLIGGIVVVAGLARFGAGSAAAAARLAVFDPMTLAILILAVLALGAVASLVATRAALRLPLAEVLR